MAATITAQRYARSVLEATAAVATAEPAPAERPAVEPEPEPELRRHQVCWAALTADERASAAALGCDGRHAPRHT